VLDNAIDQDYYRVTLEEFTEDSDNLKKTEDKIQFKNQAEHFLKNTI
jgi:hypothetical protein